MRGERSKNDEPRSIDLIGPLAEVIQRRQRDRWKGEDHTWTGYVKGLDVKSSEWVFHVEGRPISGTAFQRAWKAACTTAGVEKLFHDIRRTIFRNLIHRGIPQTVAMEITGHKTLSAFQRYDIVDRRDRRKAVLALAQPVPQDQPKAGTAKVVKLGRRTG